MSEHAHLPMKTSSPTPAIKPVPFGVLQRKCACGGSGGSGGECEECNKKGMTLQRRASDNSAPNTVPPIVYDVLRSPGHPLDAVTRAFFEPRFGHDFSRVRIHTDARAADSARAVSALAYTVGRNIVFGKKQYVPHTVGGRKLLAHELAHVVQQRFSAANHPLRIGAAGEQEASIAADSLLSPSSGPRLKVSQSPAPTLARQIDTQARRSYGDLSLSSSQGQADGGSAKEACELAKEDCKSKLNCPPDRAEVDKTCLCYKGGEYGQEGYTCLNKCRCKRSSLPVS